MTVEDTPTASRGEYRGRSYVFCSPTCCERFLPDPDRYAALDVHRDA